MARFIQFTASVRVATRVFEQVLRDQQLWREQGVDFDEIDLGPRSSEQPRAGDLKIISFVSYAGETILKVYLRLSGSWGWEAYRYEYRQLYWTTDTSRLSGGPYYSSDWRDHPVVDYYQFTGEWISVNLRPTVSQRPQIL